MQPKENDNAGNTLEGEQSTEVEDVKLSDTPPPENFEELPRAQGEAGSRVVGLVIAPSSRWGCMLGCRV